MKRTMAVVMVLVLLVLHSAGAASDTDGAVRKAFKSYRTVGGALVVAKDGEIIYEQYYGHADKTAKEKVDKDTYFRIADTSKIATSVLAMKLAEAGRLDLDRNIGYYLGKYTAGNPYHPGKPVTSRMLLTHTSSIKTSGPLSQDAKLSEVLDISRKKYGNYMKYAPGTRFQYSNYGIGILGTVIESITGHSLSVSIRSELLNRMGIDASYDPLLLNKPEKIVTTYRSDGTIDVTRKKRLREDLAEGQGRHDEADLDRDYKEGYGGLWIKARDLCSIGIMLCSKGKYAGKQILKKETVEEMLCQQKGKGGITADTPYGLGIQYEDRLDPGIVYYGHQGASNGVVSCMYFNPETGLVFVLVTNGCNNRKINYISALVRRMYEIVLDTPTTEVVGFLLRRPRRDWRASIDLYDLHKR